MLNTGQERYDNISIPDDRLLAAIERGIRKEKRLRRKRILRTFAAASAACILILLGCANIPALYAYAKEIPIVKEFVQALRIGQGGKEQMDLIPEVSSDSQSITIAFCNSEGVTDKVLSYSISYHYAPARMQIIFHGMDSSFYGLLEKKLASVNGAADLYQVKTSKKQDTAFVIVLNELYDYELMEFSNPGSLSIRFYQDAYYEAGEKHPGQTVYFLRTDAVSSDEELSSLLLNYQDEEVMQIHNASGEDILVIGEYDSQEEAYRRYEEITKKYGAEHPFYISSSVAEEVPQ